MVASLLALLMAFQQDNSAEINRLQGEVQRLSSEVNRTQTLVQNELRPMCTAEARLQTNSLRVVDAQTPIRANLLAMVSNPSETCLPAEIRVTASYFDPGDAFVCSGTTTILNFSHVQNTFLEFRPYETEVFLKWWDGATLKQQNLLCRDYQGNEVRSPSDVATSLRIFVTVAPKRGGLATTEVQVNLPRLSRQ